MATAHLMLILKQRPNLTNPSAGSQSIIIQATDSSEDVLSKGLNSISSDTSATSSLSLISGESGRAAFFIASNDLTDKTNSTAYTDALNSANQKFVQIKGPGGAASA